MSCSVSGKRIARAFTIGAIVSLIGFFGLLLSILLIRIVFLYLSSAYFLIVLVRFALAGFIIILWLYTWWKVTTIIRNKIINNPVED
ncbi:MAG: hypothetical protein ACP5I2_01385 [Fervidicoccaceae archaeon]